ncbi:GlxA family transcriptional regulator [Aurantimonas sp. C2-6-R+9]|uniref:GlxA family transcriptional regulator n=1 Tax=unclassified Aurantimonas TaxID=2638230 RepID=UPI002E184C84|nr:MULTISPECIES: GlxA family transcriptional regulator [unclassified Aurantimonas]MEC5293304.1 GlxA family transcriptional regulator [Aurantimonas sp. C2-3-R2]MEC5324838.1 GlxA family transcriptional regulator [Aurantimonas sp. A3-2-R12]MEC5383467.1 GlxA family transcriptional regulator [Aurantimonas sp. C2-6-R+9]MEC5414407.1 GlxA family transcriptional regulator [Aurantimonas sp. C2-4-R8]
MAECDGGLPGNTGFLLLPGFSMLALFGAIEPLRLTNILLGHRHHRWRIYTPDGAPARASCGMTIPADAAAAAVPPKDDPACLIVVSGFDPWPQPDRRLKSWLRRLDRRGAMLGAVDTGAFLLASADLLAGVRTAVHWESADALLEMFPELTLSENLYEIEKRRLLCAGGAAVLDMMIALLQRTHGAALAAGVADRLMHAGGLNRAHRVFSAAAEPAPVSDTDVIRAIEAMEARVETVVSIVEIARSANVSKRTLERKFRQVLDRTPSQVYLHCRLAQAQGLLRNTDMKIREVALASGFSSMSYFCRTYKRRFRRQPGSDRRLDYSLVETAGTLGPGPALLGPGAPR